MPSFALTLVQAADRSRWRRSLLFSLALHSLALLAICHRPAAVFISPSLIAQGNGEKTYRVVYFSAVGTDEISAVEPHPKLSLHAASAKVRRPRGPDRPHEQRETPGREGEPSDHEARAGTPFGSLLTGPTTGHDVRPALPVVFPDPPIVRSELPPEVRGDVIVEVTIDEHGNVVATRLLHSVGFGIDEKVLATVQNWRFRPAMMDGRPIPSKHDVYFHFPV